jgi:hypothetical protein
MSTLLSGVVFGEINWPIFPRRQFLIEGVVKAFIWINTECLIIKVENQVTTIPNGRVPSESYYSPRPGARGIPRYAELAKPLVWCIAPNAGREHRISINKDVTVGRNNKLMNQPKTYPFSKAPYHPPFPLRAISKQTTIAISHFATSSYLRVSFVFFLSTIGVLSFGDMT